MSSVCTDEIERTLASRDAFDTWRGQMQTNLTSLRAATPSFAPTLAQYEGTIFKTAACLQEKITGLNRVPSDVARLQEDIVNGEKEIQSMKDTVQISKDRLAYVKEPERHVSFYESWFPLTRPLKPVTVPVLIALSTLMTWLSVAYLLSRVGIDFLVHLNFGPGGQTSFLGRLFAQLTPAFWLLFAMSLSAILYLIYR